ncbi:hypothetical protein UlMin_045061 [Ulmus minor]
MPNDNFSDHPPTGAATDDAKSALIFVGTGCSGAVPNVMCLIQPSDPPCPVCTPALSIPPEENPNYRGNTSLLIDYCLSHGGHSYVLIDVGKTFREQVLRWFTRYKIPRVDSIVLTHDHADAVLGLDDVRSVQPQSSMNDIDPIPIYLSQMTLESVSERFPYLVQKQKIPGQVERRVAQLEWRIIEEHHEKSFVASGLPFTPLPVVHGEGYICLGFLFGEKSRVAYISDVSRIPASTEYVISKDGAAQVDLLILDTLKLSLETVKRTRPKRALFVGMNHEIDHHRDNEFLAEWSRREGIPVQFAHDGLRIPIDL